MTTSSGIVPVVELTLEEYNDLKRKEFVFEYEKTKIARRVKEGTYYDDDTCLLYGLPTKKEIQDETLAKLRERADNEKFAYKWEEVTE